MGAPPDLRMQLADDDTQGALFEEELGRRPGEGEFRGMEFIHVRARRIINEVPKASMVPFRYTINAYRGCSHACSYCLDPETQILMADGRTRAIADLNVGDEVYGTVGAGSDRRFMRTPVLDRWTTVKPAYQVTLQNGRRLIAGADHRFLSERGWKYVTGSAEDAAHRQCLTGDDRLVGADDLLPPDAAVGGRPDSRPEALRTKTDLRVRSVLPLAARWPLVDITTGTGDFIANGVVSHNCFARPTHEYLGMSTGEDFERRIVVKVNAVPRLRAELAPAKWGGHHIAMGTNTDPYQRCEGKYRLTRGIIRELSAARNPFSILTKSTLILRDLDLLADAAQRTDVAANFSIGTLDEDVWRTTEPGTPHPMRRVEAVARLNQAGIRCGVLIAPVLPGLSDRPEQLEAVVKACVEAGAQTISPLLLHLRPGVKEHYLSWLEASHPELMAEHARLYPRSYAPKSKQRELTDLVGDLLTRHGHRPTHPRDARNVRPPSPNRAGSGSGSVDQQLTLRI